MARTRGLVESGRGAPERGPQRRAPDHRAERRSDAPAFRKAGADLVVLYGVHAVREALRVKGRKLLALYATPAAAERIAPDAALAGLTPQIVEPADLDVEALRAELRATGAYLG